MNYLDSSEYQEWKEQLRGEYKEKFAVIEQYYYSVNTKDSYEVQVTLSQILGDLLLAQKEEKPIERVIGKDIRKYAVQMLKAEYDTHKKRVFYWFHLSLLAVWLILFLIFTKTFLFHGYDELSFIEKTNHIYIGIYEVFIILAFSLGELIRTKVAAFMFFRPKLIFLTRMLLTFLCSFLIVLYNDIYTTVDRIFAVRIPAILFTVLAVPLTCYFIITCIMSLRKTREKKSKLLSSQNELLPEQVICPSCGYKHDYDYPKCPHCGFHAAIESEDNWNREEV